MSAALIRVTLLCLIACERVIQAVRLSYGLDKLRERTGGTFDVQKYQT